MSQGGYSASGPRPGGGLPSNLVPGGPSNRLPPGEGPAIPSGPSTRMPSLWRGGGPGGGPGQPEWQKYMPPVGSVVPERYRNGPGWTGETGVWHPPGTIRPGEATTMDARFQDERYGQAPWQAEMVRMRKQAGPQGKPTQQEQPVGTAITAGGPAAAPVGQPQAITAYDTTSGGRPSNSEIIAQSRPSRRPPGTTVDANGNFVMPYSGPSREEFQAMEVDRLMRMGYDQATAEKYSQDQAIGRGELSAERGGTQLGGWEQFMPPAQRRIVSGNVTQPGEPPDRPPDFQRRPMVNLPSRGRPPQQPMIGAPGQGQLPGSYQPQRRSFGGK